MSKGQLSGGGATIAQLRNVSLFAAALDDAMNRHMHLPGLVVLHGPSGFGKTFAATYSANVHRAHYVEVRSTWTKRALCLGILKEIGVEPATRVYEMVAQIAEHLAASNRPLILDEADHVLAAGAIELVRDIHESSGAVIALIGEERLPNKLRAIERIHNRVVSWVGAMPADMEDAQLLARLYCRGLSIGDDLMAAIIKASDGGARRICINLNAVADEAKKRPAGMLDLDWWGEAPLFTGKVEARTSFLPPVTRGRDRSAGLRVVGG